MSTMTNEQKIIAVARILASALVECEGDTADAAAALAVAHLNMATISNGGDAPRAREHIAQATLRSTMTRESACDLLGAAVEELALAGVPAICITAGAGIRDDVTAILSRIGAVYDVSNTTNPTPTNTNAPKGT